MDYSAIIYAALGGAIGGALGSIIGNFFLRSNKKSSFKGVILAAFTVIGYLSTTTLYKKQSEVSRLTTTIP